MCCPRLELNFPESSKFRKRVNHFFAWQMGLEMLDVINFKICEISYFMCSVLSYSGDSVIAAVEMCPPFELNLV